MSPIDQNEDNFFSLGLMVIVPLNEKKVIEQKLNKLCGFSWPQNTKIKLVYINESNLRNPRDIISQIKRSVLKLNSKEICVLPKILISEQCIDVIDEILILDNLQINSIKRVPFNLLSTTFLNKYIKDIACTWKDNVLSQLKKWTHDNIDAAQVEVWLRQFDATQSDSKRWIGEFLLKNLNLYTHQEMVQNFFISGMQLANEANSNTAHCFIRYEDGKSADAISQILKKPAASFTGLTLDPKNWQSVLTGANDYEFIVVYEDGLFTGVELKGILLSLTGNANGKKEIPALEEIHLNRFLNLPHQFKFCIATDVGIHRLKQAIDALGIPATVTAGVVIKTLTESGVEALKNDCLYKLDADDKEVIFESEKNVLKGIFEKTLLEIDISNAMSYCRDICKMLWESNLLIRKKKSWTAARLNDCSLGAGNMALAIAFASSVPKSTLPVFWCHGEVLDMKGNKFLWKPLFESAHPINGGLH